MHTGARSVSEYSPSPVQGSQAVAVMPIEAEPAKQSPHSVSAVGEQELIMYLPEAQVAQVEQPAAPAPLVSPSPHSEHSLAPPVEYVPAAHCSSPCDERGRVVYVSFLLNKAPCMLLAYSHHAIRCRLVSGLGCLTNAGIIRDRVLAVHVALCAYRRRPSHRRRPG